jgi:cell division transport system ATP-binding protein
LKTPKPTSTPLAELRAVSVVYPNGAVGLCAMDLTINSAELIVLSGRSGSGKSTCLGALSGRLDIESGSVVIRGRLLRDLNREELRIWRQHSAYVAQDAPMLERRTVAENLAYAVEIAQPNDVDAHAEIDCLLERLAIADTADRRPSELSGGERQRAALAQGLAKRPAILFADEPTANLDPTTAASVVATIAQYCGQGMACLAASHSPAVFAKVGRHISMAEGRVVSESDARRPGGRR